MVPQLHHKSNINGSFHFKEVVFGCFDGALHGVCSTISMLYQLQGNIFAFHVVFNCCRPLVVGRI